MAGKSFFPAGKSVFPAGKPASLNFPAGKSVFSGWEAGAFKFSGWREVVSFPAGKSVLSGWEAGFLGLGSCAFRLGSLLIFCHSAQANRGLERAHGEAFRPSGRSASISAFFQLSCSSVRQILSFCLQLFHASSNAPIDLLSTWRSRLFTTELQNYSQLLIPQRFNVVHRCPWSSSIFK